MPTASEIQSYAKEVAAILEAANAPKDQYRHDGSPYQRGWQLVPGKIYTHEVGQMYISAEWKSMGSKEGEIFLRPDGSIWGYLHRWGKTDENEQGWDNAGVFPLEPKSYIGDGEPFAAVHKALRRLVALYS